MTTEEEQARQEAEARRQKILEAADGRLDVVTGVVGEKKQSSTAAAKMAAARRRRFKKTAKQEQEDQAEEAEEAEEAEASVAPEADGVEQPQAKEEPVQEEEAVAAPAPSPTPTVTTASAESNNERETKKYMGVAKMRRKMLKERKEKQVPEPAATAVAPPLPLKKKKAFLALPICMHALTVLLLFFAGVDVGLQQHAGTSVVHADLAPREFGLNLWARSAPIASPRLDTGYDGWTGEMVLEDEFGQDVTEEKENLDPLFGVDLDQLTKGSGLYLWLARRAVQMHRLNLRIFYYGPINVVNGIVNALKSLLVTPPLLCLVALTIRQFVGKTVLGAKLPDKTENGEQAKEVISMAKNFIKSFALRAFPNAATAYSTWTSLRADMYVILCGVLVGLAWSYSGALPAESVDELVFEVADEGVPDIEPEEPVLPTDEL